MSYLNPRNINRSQKYASTSMISALGKAKPNQLAKLITSPFPGKSLQRRKTEI